MPAVMEAGTPYAQGTRMADEQLNRADPTKRFQLHNVLGKGAYGTVYKAFDTATQQFVAIKVIPVTDQDREEFLQIQREINFLSDCNHPNVVRYMGSYQRTNELWIVMEYCGGGSVSDLISATGQPLPEELIAHICCESLKGLAYLHSLGKVHRDIKCGNILLGTSGEVKIADFGVSAQLTATMSKRQTFIGTPHWMAPEVIQESRYDGKVDVWALGISAIEMAEMTPPRWAVHPLRVIFMISRDPPPKLSQPERCGPVFQDFITQSLMKDPKQRPTARYLLQHRFVVQQRPGAAVAVLLPLLEHTQRYLQENSVVAPTESSQELKNLAGMATGRFSWRGATVLSAAAGAAAAERAVALPSEEQLQGGAGHPGRPPRGAAAPAPAAQGPAGGAAALPRMGLAPLLTPGANNATKRRSSSGGYDSTMVVKPDYGGTVVIHHDAATMLVHHNDSTIVVHPSGTPLLSPPSRAAAADMRSPLTPALAAAGGSDFGTTMVVAGSTMQLAGGAASGGGDVAGTGGGGGYMAAVRAAAAEVQHRDRHHHAGDSPAVPAVATAVSDRERTRERLHAIYDSGLVVPLPFLRAADVQPLALLRPLGPQPQQPAVVQPPTGAGEGLQGSLEPEAHVVLLELVAQADAASVQSSRDGPVGGQPLLQPDALPPAVAQQLQSHPGLQNLACTLAYNRRCLTTLPLDRSTQAELQAASEQLAAALTCILGL